MPLHSNTGTILAHFQFSGRSELLKDFWSFEESVKHKELESFFNKIVGIPSGPTEYLLANLLKIYLILSTSKIISSAIKLSAPTCCNSSDFPLSTE